MFSAKRTTLLLPLVFLAVAAVMPLWAAKPAKVPEADKLKAEYIFLEAANARAEDRVDDYYMLIRRAAALDTEDPYILGSLAEIDILLPTVDSAATMKAYGDLRRRFLADPTVDTYAEIYASIASRMRRYDDVIEVWSLIDSLRSDRTDPAMNLGNALLLKGHFQGDTASLNKAVNIFNRLQSGLPGNIMLASRKIAAFSMLSDSASVVAELQRLHREAPADVSSLLFIGDNYRSFNTDSAMVYYDRAAILNPEDGRVFFKRAELYSILGDSSAYDREIERAFVSPGMEFEEKLELLTGYVSKFMADTTQRSRINAMFRVMQEVNPGEARLHGLYGAYESAVGNDSLAAEQFGYCIDLDPNEMDAWEGLVQSYGNMNDAKRVTAAARKALERFPDHIYFGLMGASGLMMQDEQRQALAMLDSVDISSSDNPNLLSHYYTVRGDLLYSLEEVDSALVSYDKAIGYNADNYMALNNAAYFMAEKGGDLDRAEVYASIASAGESGNATFLDTYAWVLFKKREYPRALEIINRALAAIGALPDTVPGVVAPVVPDADDEEKEQELSPEIIDHAGDIYFMNGLHAEAVKFWEKALELDPGNEAVKKKVTHRTYFFE